MESTTHLNMHRDHAIWQSDLSMWTHDLKMWEQEIEGLEQVLSFFEEAVRQHKITLVDHVRVLAEHKARLQRHEIDLSIVKEGTKLDLELSDEHEAEHLRHKEQRRAHERLKKYHHSVVTLSKSLKKALESPV